MHRPSPAVARVVAVINFFVEHPQQSFTLTDVVNALKLSRATCHALLVTLVETGYLYRIAGKRYVIGPDLIAAGRIARENYSPFELVRVEMRSLADENDAICTALWIEKNELVVRDRAGSMFHLGWLPQVGQRISMNARQDGVSLAWSDERVFADWMASVGIKPDSEDAQIVRDGMEAGRRRGYIYGIRDVSWTQDLAYIPVNERRLKIDMSQTELDDHTAYSLSSISAPVDDGNDLKFNLSLSFFRRDLTGKEIHETAARLVEAAQRISTFARRAGR